MSNTTWKFWDIYTEFIRSGLGAIRGYVTSSGTPSLDLGIPPSAQQPVLMLRECRQELLEPTIDAGIIREMNSFIKGYEDLLNRKADYEKLYQGRQAFLGFLSSVFMPKVGEQARTSQEKKLYQIRERIADILGMMRVVAMSKNSLEAIAQIDEIARAFFGIKTSELTYEDFKKVDIHSKKKIVSFKEWEKQTGRPMREDLWKQGPLA